MMDSAKIKRRIAKLEKELKELLSIQWMQSIDGPEMQAIESVTGHSIVQILSSGRDPELVYARMVLCNYWINQGYHYTAISKRLNRDRTSLYNMVKKHSIYLEVIPLYRYWWDSYIACVSANKSNNENAYIIRN